MEEIAFEGAQVVTPANISLVQDLNLRCGSTLAIPPLEFSAQYQPQSHPLNAKQRCHNVVRHGLLPESLALEHGDGEEIAVVVFDRILGVCSQGVSGPMSAFL